MASIFEKMIQDFSKKDTVQLLKECMEMDAKKMKKIPLRYRLIAVGFVSHMSLEALETKLKENGCEQLYARNFIEASLIYAFSKGLSYEQWIRLEKLAEERINDAETEKGWFSGSVVTYSELKEYVRSNSDIQGVTLKTQKITKRLSDEISKQNTEEEFLEFMERNREDFRNVREKARYYFCKYLTYYIEEKVENYIAARKTGFAVEQAASELNLLKCAAKLRGKFSNDQDILDTLDACGLSFGNIYDAFNYFYFEYISADWLEIQLEYYGADISRLTTAEKQKLAHGIRAYENGWDALSDEEVITRKLREKEEVELQTDREYSLSASGNVSADRGYQKNRSGEKSVRNYIKGTVDIDRTTLVCYLLFLGQESLMHKEHVITRERLDEILGECGYSILREEDDFDCFVIQYLLADDRVEFLMESVTDTAMEEKNFYLYHMYQGAISENDKLKNLLK